MAIGDTKRMGRDPRNADDFNEGRWTNDHPLGIQRTSHLTVVVNDLDKASSLYEKALGGRKLHAAATPAYGTDSVFYHVGTQTVVELAKPVAAGMAKDDMEHNGEIIHAVTWRVKNLADAEAYMRTHSIGVVERNGETITLDPTDTYGANHASDHGGRAWRHPRLNTAHRGSVRIGDGAHQRAVSWLNAADG